MLLCAEVDCTELLSTSSSDVGRAVVALGNTWSHCVNTRLIVQYVDDVSRQVCAIFSAFFLVFKSAFIIT